MREAWQDAFRPDLSRMAWTQAAAAIRSLLPAVDYARRSG
jgi:hypothetical protein